MVDDVIHTHTHKHTEKAWPFGFYSNGNLKNITDICDIIFVFFFFKSNQIILLWTDPHKTVPLLMNLAAYKFKNGLS